MIPVWIAIGGVVIGCGVGVVIGALLVSSSFPDYVKCTRCGYVMDASDYIYVCGEEHLGED